MTHSAANNASIRADHERAFKAARIPFRYYDRRLGDEMPDLADAFARQEPALFVGDLAFDAGSLFAREALFTTQRIPARLEALDIYDNPDVLAERIRREPPAVVIEGLEAVATASAEFWGRLARFVSVSATSGRRLLLTAEIPFEGLPAHALQRLRRMGQ